MERKELTVPCAISREQFREYAVFDTLRRQKRWIRPAAFALFFVGIAALSFSRADGVRGAALLGGVLLAVGLGLPAVYFGSFFRSVYRRAREINPDETAYIVTLSETEVLVKKGGQTVSRAWPLLHGAFRLRHGICLYMDPVHALLLPDDRDGLAWQVISAGLGERAKDFHRLNLQDKDL